MGLRFLRVLLASACLFVSSLCYGADWLIASDSEQILAGRSFRLQVVKPDTFAEWPRQLALTLGWAKNSRRVALRLADDEPSAGEARRTYVGEAPAAVAGVVRVELAGEHSNPVLMLAERPDALSRMSEEGQAGQGMALPETPREPALSANEPMYFVVGNRGGANARFQLSFKYRLFDQEGVVVHRAPWLENFHFGYTQTVLWDLGSNSKPFHDTSYRPSLFWQWQGGEKESVPRLWRAGYEHESNGKDGTNSRSIDTLFVQPTWALGNEDEVRLLLSPKLYAYLDKEDNPDIQQYRGYVDWNFRYGREKGWLLSALLRRGTAGHGSAQLDLSYPLREPVFSRVGGFLYLQLFSGYGETMLDYNLRRDTQLRVGFSVVR